MKLQIDKLDVQVDNKEILKNFNLLVNNGEIHTIMGPNGVGKSTLSRVIMGDSHYKVINGDIKANDKSILDLRVDERSRLGIFLAMQYPMEIEGVSNQDFLRTAISSRDGKKIGLYQFIKKCEEATDELSMNKELIHRSLNIGFSGGEKKKNEVLQIKLLEPGLIIMDELDSGLDIDSMRIVAENIIKYKEEHPDTSIIIITHYAMILDILKPDYVHILHNGHIVKTGNYSLAGDILENGFSKYIGTGEEVNNE
jgi:Fe-S cluster assembly ATP-binding protein